MLGEKHEKGSGNVLPTISQSAFIRSLIATFIKTTNTKSLGGLFGAKLNDGNLLLWNRTQQAAFLILAWRKITNAIENCNEEWAISLRSVYQDSQNSALKDEILNLDAAYASKLSLISTDQGVRGFLSIINDMLFIQNSNLNLNSIQSPDEIKEDGIDDNDIKRCLVFFEKNDLLINYLSDISDELVRFDWRTASTPGLSNEKRQKQMVFKGSSGYKEIRAELLKQLKKSNNKVVSGAANVILNELGYAH
jgi:hypothetical protein